LGKRRRLGRKEGERRREKAWKEGKVANGFN